ncbi:MAG: phosphoenolpyruvate-utilizing N-terminal domain-containing protein, partial [Ferrimicrobium acidiphilum]
MSDLGGSSSGSGQDSSTEELRGFGVGTRSVSGRIVRIGKQPPLIEGRNSGEASEGNDSAQVDSAFGDSDSIEFEGRDALRSRLSEMLEVVGIELETLGQNAPSEVADILEAQAMMAQDPTLVDRLLANVEPDPMVDAKCQLQRRNLRAAFEKVAAELRSVGGYIGERADDIGEIGARVADHLFGSADSQAIDEPNVNSILLFDQLTAAQASTLTP